LKKVFVKEVIKNMKNKIKKRGERVEFKIKKEKIC